MKISITFNNKEKIVDFPDKGTLVKITPDAKQPPLEAKLYYTKEPINDCASFLNGELSYFSSNPNLVFGLLNSDVVPEFATKDYGFAFFYKVIIDALNDNPEFSELNLDDKTYNITWQTGDKFGVKVKNNNITFDVPKNYEKTKTQMLTEFLLHNKRDKIVKMCRNEAKKMGISWKVQLVSIADVSDIDFNNPENSARNLQGCLGINRCINHNPKKVDKLDLSNFATGDKNKYIITFSPLVCYLSYTSLKQTIIHELTHAQIGNEHGHDSFFWQSFEKNSGFNRTEDVSYKHQEEIEDNKLWDMKYPATPIRDICNGKIHNPNHFYHER